MQDLRIQFLSFDGCPLADAARDSLEKALAELGRKGYEEINILDPGTPAELRSWGSPTILVNGEDVSGYPKGDGVGCRVYPGPDRVPSPRTIIERVKALAADSMEEKS